MKKLFLLLAVVGLMFSACTEGGGIEDESGTTEQPGGSGNNGSDDGEKPEDIFFALDREEITIKPDGGSAEVVVYSNYKWVISGTSDWCTPSVKEGNANEDGQKVTLSADVAYDAREALFWFRCADKAIKLVVKQNLKEVIIADDNNTFDVPAEGGTIEIAYQTSVECEVIIPDEAKEWITIAPETKGLVSEKVNLNVAENKTYEARSAVIKVVKKGDSTPCAEYTVNQQQNDAIIADDNNTFEVPSEGGNIEIAYQTNVECKVVIPDEAKEWITIVPETKGLVSEKVNLTVAENKTYGARSAVIKVVAADNEELMAEYTINQKQNDAILADGNTTFEVPAKGGTVEIAYQTNVECKVIIPNEAKSWITIAPETKGLVSEKVTLNIAENKTYEARSAVIKVVKRGDNTPCAEYTVNQQQNDAIIADGNNTFEIPIEGSNVEIAYQTNVECKVIIPDEAKDWITLAPVTKGLVSEKTTLTVAANITEEARMAVIKVVAAGNEKLMAEYTINQAHGYILKYTSSNGNIITPYKSDAFGATILVNEYKDGIGYLVFDAPVTSIGEDAFSDCSSLTNITIPDSVTEIGESAFDDCSSLTSITIPDSVTEIGMLAFSGCSSLTSITIPDSVTSIGMAAFNNCTSLTSITIPNSVTEIGSYTFSGCSSLPSITIPDSVTSIGEDAFAYCTSLTSITIPDSVTSIGYSAFNRCSSLTSVSIPDSVTSIGWHAFYGCYFNESDFVNNSQLDAEQNGYWGATICIVQSDGLCIKGTTVVFCKRNVTSVTIPDSVTEIGSSAFEGCTCLTSVTIGDSVTEIGWYAFSGCSSLTSVTIPDSVTSIGEGAFYNCSSLKEVYCKPTTPPTAKLDASNVWRAFDNNASGRKIYVPRNSVSAYKAANGWSSYASAIVGYDF